MLHKVCRWVPQNKRLFNETEVLVAKGFSFDSCQPCSNSIVPTDSLTNVRQLDYTFNDENMYFLTSRVTRAGTYSVMGAMLT